MSSTLAETLAEITQRFEDAGVPSPRLDARLIVAHALAESTERLLLEPKRMLDDGEQGVIRQLAARRVAREPVAHLLGRKEFWSLSFAVTPDVLAPRPDSESVVEAVLERLPDRTRPLRILDLGTGTGCLLLALLTELPCASGVGVDRSHAAARVARGNAVALGLADRVSIVVADWGTSLSAPFDVVVVNPPYISESDISGLEPEVARFEPRLALAGGRDGLECYRCLGADLMRLVGVTGFAVVEVGAGTDRDVSVLFAEAGLTVEGTRRDLGGIARALTVARRARGR